MKKCCHVPALIGTYALNGWAGITRYSVRIVGETPKNYRIKTISPHNKLKLPGRNRWLHPGETKLMPKHRLFNIREVPQ